MKKLWLTGIVITLLFSQVGFSKTAEETFKKEFAFPENGNIRISNVNGKVEVRGWEQSRVQIVAYKQVRASSAREAEKALKDLEIKVIQQDGDLSVEAIFPRKKGGGLWDMIFGNGYSASVRYEITVPTRSNLELESVNGAVYVLGIEGRVKAKTTNGKVILEQLKGLARARTTNGSIEASFQEVPPEGEMEFLTTNGSIKLFLPADLRCTVQAQTANGSISSDLPLQVQGNISKRKLSGDLNGGGNLLLYLQTVNGSIRIHEVNSYSMKEKLERQLDTLRLKIKDRAYSFYAKLPETLKNLLYRILSSGQGTMLIKKLVSRVTFS